MRKFVSITIVTFITAVFAVNSAHARWGGGYYACKKTPLIEFDGTIAEAVDANPFGNLGTLLQAVEAADPLVLEALSNEDAELTVFAPVDSAFEAIPDDILGSILRDQELVTNVLLYHVVGFEFDPRRVYYVKKKDSLLGQDLFINRAYPNPRVNQSDIECQGVETANGLVWLINSVLLPQF